MINFLLLLILTNAKFVWNEEHDIFLILILCLEIVNVNCRTYVASHIMPYNVSNLSSIYCKRAKILFVMKIKYFIAITVFIIYLIINLTNF